LYDKGYLKQFISQNHDGLPLKAGMPWSIVNEIHGGWFDKKNGVKMMDDTLNPNNLKRYEEWREKSDLVIVVGTSLAGMNADRIAIEAGMNPDKNLIIINL
jgi:NAD-dependent SIR2 family protein deacetylase